TTLGEMQRSSTGRAEVGRGDPLHEMPEFLVAVLPDLHEPPAVRLGEELHVPPHWVHRGRLEVRAEIPAEAHLRRGDRKSSMAQVVTRRNRTVFNRRSKVVERDAQGARIHGRDRPASGLPETE